jgi:hypothetical protein
MTNRHCHHRYRIWCVDTDLRLDANAGPIIAHLDPKLSVRRRCRTLRSLVGGRKVRHVTYWPK